MQKKVSDWLHQPMNVLFFKLSVIAISLSYFAHNMLVHLYDTDTYFLIDTGREIIKRGDVIRENIWSCVPGMKFVAQQWLYCVVTAFMQDTFGALGMFFLMFVQIAAYYLLAVHLMKKLGLDSVLRWLLATVVVILGQSYLFSTRPETITIIFFILLALCLEKFKETDKWYWLLGIPVLNVLEVNFHSSMWLFHYAIIFAYLVPAFYWPWKAKETKKIKWKSVAVASILSLPTLLINPYGLDGALYIVNSYRAKTFDWVMISEMQATQIMSIYGVCALVGVLILIVSSLMKSSKSTSVNMTLGFSLLMAMAVRNNMFLLFSLIYPLADLGCAIVDKGIKINWKKDLNRAVCILLIAADVFFIGLLYDRFDYIDGGNEGRVEDSVAFAKNMNTIVDYLDDNAEEGVKILSGFDSGAYLEYRGYRNLFIDARPECYMKPITGNKNLLAEYSMYCTRGVRLVQKKGEPYMLTTEEVEAWFAKYDFDYIVVDSGIDCFLAGYMYSSPNYVLAPGSEDVIDEPWLLFERIDRVEAREEAAAQSEAEANEILEE